MRFRTTALALLLLAPLAASISTPAGAAASETLSEIVDILREEGLIDDAQHRELSARADEQESRLAWLDRISLWGDFRARYEGFWFSRDAVADIDDRHRGRYRGRLNLSGKVNEHATVYFRLVSGGADPRTTNQTFGSGNDFDTDDFRFDLAYATLTPLPGGELPWFENGYLAVDVGKVKNPYTWKELGEDKLLWDSDITLEGGNLRIKGDAGALSFFANGGGYIIDENSGGQDPALLAGQVGATTEVAEKVSFGARGTLYHYFSLDDAFFTRATGSLAMPTGAGGNLPGGLSLGRGSIQVGETSAFLAFAHSELFPVQIFGSYAHNYSARATAAGSRKNDAYNFGVIVGDKKRSVRLSAAYYVMEANAAPSMYIDSDVLDAKPNRHGYAFTLNRQLLKNVEFASQLFLSDRLERGPAYAVSVAGSDRVRFRADLKFRF